jgi:hypothetical protein
MDSVKLKDMKENINAKLNAVSSDAFDDCFAQLLKRSKVLQPREITLQENKSDFLFISRAFVLTDQVTVLYCLTMYMLYKILLSCNKSHLYSLTL